MPSLERSTARSSLLTTTALLVFAVAAAAVPGMARAEAPSADGVAMPSAEGTSGDAITVTGQRQSTDTAIASKKAATGVVDVISADDLGKLPDASVADSLGRIPGVSVIVNQDTGEGEYVSIRGLDGTYNATSINGVRVAQTDPSSRDVSLNLLPPNGLAAVSVTKTLTPDLDGDAIAGAIDFRTPTAFDFKKKTTARLYVNGGWNDRAKSVGEASGTYQVQGDFATRFADDRFGVFASANYGISHGNGEETENDGEWEPYHYRANSTDPIDTSNMHLPGIDLDYRRLKQTRYGGNFSFDYHGDNTKLYLRGQYAKLKIHGTNDTTAFNNSGTPRLEQIDPKNSSLAQPDQAIVGHDSRGNIYSYTTSQIKDTDGDGMITDADRSGSGLWSLAGASGVWDPQAFEFGRFQSVIDLDQNLGTLDAGGHSDFGRFHLDYDASYSAGTRGTPGNASIAYDCSPTPGDSNYCSNPLFQTGINWVSGDPRFPKAGLSPIAQNVEHDPSLLPFDGASMDKWKQKDNRIALKLDARYDFGGILDYVKIGGKYTRSQRHYDYTPIWSGDFTGTALDGKNLADSGLIDKDVKSTLSGQYYYGAVFSRQAVENAIRAAMAANPDGLPSATDLVSQDTRSTEKIYAGYALAHFKLNAIDVVTGGRVEHRDTHNEFWVDDGAASGPGTTDRGYTVFLPSINATFRPDDKQVYRAAVWTGYSPPEYSYISGGKTVSRDPGTNEIIAISQGNPDLKAARATNFDVSAEYYPDQSSMVSAAGFYKKIRNFIFTNGGDVTAPTRQGFIDITQPQNGKDANLYGVELALVKSFQGLIPPFDGFGFEGNVTIQHSSADTGLDYRNGKKIPLIDAPKILYNASLTYQKYGIEAKLSYSYRGKYIESLRDNAVDKWVQHNRSVDLHTRYNVNDRLALDFDVSNLLDDWKYYTTKGPSPSYMKDYMEPGRTLLWRASYIF